MVIKKESIIRLSLISNWTMSAASDSFPLEKRGYLYSYLKVPVFVLTLSGFGSPFTKRQFTLRLLYTALSVYIISLLAFGLVRSAMFLSWSWRGSLDMHFAQHIIFMGWCAQGLFSISFVLYHSRRGSLIKFHRLWHKCDVDELIAHSSFQRFRFFWLAPAFFYVSGFTLLTCVTVFLQHKNIVQRSWELDFVFYPSWNIYYFAPCALFLQIAWGVPQYCYFVVCLLFRYAWVGLCAKIDKYDQRCDYGTVCRTVTLRHNQLYQVMCTINKLFGPYVFFQMTVSVPIILLEIYLLASTNEGPGVTAKLLKWLIGNVIYVIMTLAAALINVSANQVSQALYGRYVDHYNKWVEENESKQPEKEVPHLMETLILLEKMHNTNVSMSALGCFEVTRSFLVTLWSVLVTYYMVLIQFSQPYTGFTRNCTNCSE